MRVIFERKASDAAWRTAFPMFVIVGMRGTERARGARGIETLRRFFWDWERFGVYLHIRWHVVTDNAYSSELFNDHHPNCINTAA
jgi:hypothetical protein